MKLLFDINVLLDVVLGRAQWAADGARLLQAVEDGRADGFVASHALTTVFYVVAAKRDRATAMIAVTDLLRLLSVVPLGDDDFHAAIALNLRDFEDSMQAAACFAIGADYLVTRNAKDFRHAPVTPRTAAEVWPLLDMPGNA